MDEAAYRQILSATISTLCPFEKSILAHCAACSCADKRNIAEREVVACSNLGTFQRCVLLRDLLRNNFTFALGKLHIDGPLPHAQEMRMQCGGLRGLKFTLDENDQIDDIAELVTIAQQRYGELADFPYAQIVRLANTLYKSR